MSIFQGANSQPDVTYPGGGGWYNPPYVPPASPTNSTPTTPATPATPTTPIEPQPTKEEIKRAETLADLYRKTFLDKVTELNVPQNSIVSQSENSGQGTLIVILILGLIVGGGYWFYKSKHKHGGHSE